MLDKMETHLHQELLERYSTENALQKEVFSDASFIPFLQHIKKHQYFYRIALKTRQEFPLKQGYEGLWNQIIKPKCEKAGITSESEMLYYFVYFQAGFTMLLKHWVDNDCAESEAELTKILQNSIPSIWKIS